MKVSSWIIDLVKEVSEKNHIRVPEIKVRRKARSYSGTASHGLGKIKDRIVIRYSKTTPKWEKKLVILHELTHLMMPLREGHSDNFWKKAFELYKEYKLPIRKVMANERSYRRSSVNAYRAIQGLKPKKVTKRKIKIDSLERLKYLSWPILGIRDTDKDAWAITELNGERWRGYKLTKVLFKKLVKDKLYPII